MTNVQLLESRGIKLKGKTAGEFKTLCPECTATRKNKHDTSLSVNIDDGVWNCHNCGFRGGVFHKTEKIYEKPVARLEKLGAKSLKFFEKDRCISNDTLLRFKISETLEPIGTHTSPVPVICFNYFREDELCNIKFRGPLKSFRMTSGAELIFYNLDAIKNESECVIVEGEIDCLSMHEAGIYNSVSVPNGASKGNQKLEYLDNCFSYFADKKRIILAVDGDDAGYLLRDELARRLGRERCWKVEYPEGCKDANDVLVMYGKEKLLQVIARATQWPVEGILDVPAMEADIVRFYESGYPEGCRVGITGIDQHITFMEGQVTTVTGIPGSGKSEVVDWLMCMLSKNHQWQWAVCSFENQPSSIHVTKLMEKFIGKSFAERLNEIYRMTIPEAETGLGLVAKYFHFVNLTSVDLTLSGLLGKARELVSRKGIKGLVIDPWNYIEHKIPQGYTETQYISECLTDIKTFALQTGVHVFLIAHPTKIRKNEMGKYEVPTLYNISGSAHFFNKTDNGLTIYRDFETGVVTIYIQKIRFSWLGKIGFCSFEYNTFTRQYKEIA